MIKCDAMTSLEQKESMNENSLLKGKLENMELENTQMTQDLVNSLYLIIDY